MTVKTKFETKVTQNSMLEKPERALFSGYYPAGKSCGLVPQRNPNPNLTPNQGKLYN